MFDLIKQKLLVPYRAACNAMQVEKHTMNDAGMMDIRGIVLIGVSAFITAAFLPPAIQALAEANTTGFSSTDAAVFGIIGTIILIVVILGYLKMVD